MLIYRGFLIARRIICSRASLGVLLRTKRINQMCQSIRRPFKSMDLAFSREVNRQGQRNRTIPQHVYISYTDVDECAGSPPVCSQQCINTMGSFTCACDHGYQLARDGIKCDGKVY